jgi:hypothetical protein
MKRNDAVKQGAVVGNLVRIEYYGNINYDTRQPHTNL